MDKNKTNFEKNWQEKVLNHSEEVSDTLWNTIQEKRKERKKIISLKWIYPAIGIAASLILIFNLLQEPPSAINSIVEAQEGFVENPTKPILNDQAAIADDKKNSGILLAKNEPFKISKKIKEEKTTLITEENTLIHSKTFVVNSPVHSDPKPQLIKNSEPIETLNKEEIPIQIVTVSLEEKKVDDVIIIQISSPKNQDKEERKKLVKNILNGIGKVLDGTYSMDNEKILDIKSKKNL